MEILLLSNKLKVLRSVRTAENLSSSFPNTNISSSAQINAARTGGTITQKLCTGERPQSTHTPARAAGSPSRPTAITTGNTALTSATSRIGLEVIAMTDDQFKREALYQATMSMFQSMLRSRLITQEQYQVIDTKMKEKYRPIIGTLCGK